MARFQAGRATILDGSRARTEDTKGEGLRRAFDGLHRSVQEDDFKGAGTGIESFFHLADATGTQQGIVVVPALRSRCTWCGVGPGFAEKV